MRKQGRFVFFSTLGSTALNYATGELRVTTNSHHPLSVSSFRPCLFPAAALGINLTQRYTMETSLHELGLPKPRRVISPLSELVVWYYVYTGTHP